VRRLQFCQAGWRQKLHYLGFALWVVAWVLVWRPTWIYASDPLSCPIALGLSCLPGLRVLYHEHDSPSEPPGGPPLSALRSPLSSFQLFVSWCRRKLARRAAICVLPNEKRVERFRQATGTARPVVCVWNCPRREEAKRASSARADGPTLYYHGNIGSHLVPLSVVEALAGVPQLSLRIIGYTTIGNEAHLRAIQNLATKIGAAGRVQCIPAMPRQRLLEEARKATMGLAVMPGESYGINYQGMVGASNKAFDYLACGLPLLVSDSTDWRMMFVEPGYALACNPEDPASIGRALRWFVEHPEETRRMGERGRERILREWNYETQFAKVRSILEEYPARQTSVGQ